MTGRTVETTTQPTTQSDIETEKAEAEKSLKEIWNSIGNGPGRNALEEGWAESFGYLAETLSVGGQNYQSHGMGKSGFAYAIRDLFELFNKGIAADRGGGQLYTAPLAISEENKGAASALGTAGGTAYTDGAFVLVAKKGIIGIRNINDIGGILVNSGLTDINPEILTELRKAFPDLVIESYKNAKGLVEQLNKNAELDALEGTTSKVESAINKIKNKGLINPDLLLRADRKLASTEAAEEMIKAAIPWYNSLKLPDGRLVKDLVPLKVMLDAINENPQVVAHWNLSGITLFKGSDASDLYHEAWHMFTNILIKSR